MKRIKRKIYIAGIVAMPLLLGACADVDKECDPDDGQVYEVSRVTLNMAGTTNDIQAGATRAVSGFVVNTADDPTHDLTKKLGWELDFTLYDINDDYYPSGSGTFTWNSTDGYWYAGTILYMPNYLMEKVEAELYPVGWDSGTSEIATDQRQEADLILQDILVQNGTPYYLATPAHLLEVEMRHAHSMIDFVLADVDPDQIETVTVTAGGKVYQPYKTDPSATSRQEYLVILPVGTTDPVVNVTTVAGANYHKTLDIPSSEINTCYYVRLVGLELTLESIAVSFWNYGQGVAGDYSSVTSYPTFRGPDNMTIKIYYDNGRDQQITFNDRGEATVKPTGRTIVRIESQDGSTGYTFSPPLSIRTQVIDLNEYIALMS